MKITDMTNNVEVQKAKVEHLQRQLDQARKLVYHLFPEVINACTELWHTTNAEYCAIKLNDNSQPTWEDAPQWQKDSAVNGVLYTMFDVGGNPESNHVNWMQEKIRAGWVYGDVKDVEAKTHPCLVPYEQLPEEQKAKDKLFRGVVEIMVRSLYNE